MAKYQYTVKGVDYEVEIQDIEGNIVCFRNLQKRTDAAIARFSDATTNGVVTLRPFSDYYNGYTDEKGKYNEGYVDLIATLQQDFPLTDVRIVGEARQKAFIRLFGAILRMRNLLAAFDDFKGMDIDHPTTSF